jgi:hypothetical protein
MSQAQVAKPVASTGSGVNGGKFQDKDKPMEVRMSNITAAKGKKETSIRENVACHSSSSSSFSCW